MTGHRVARAAVAGFLILTLGAPLPVWSAGAALGTARGVRSVALSLDGGKTWLPLTARSLPLMDGSELRSTSGAALIELTDGSRLNVLPFSSLRARDTGAAIEMLLVYGRVTFRFAAGTRVDLRSASAHLAPAGKQTMAGEMFAGSDGTLGLRMTEGALRVQELSGETRTMLASTEPVFLPRRPATSGPLFTSDLAVAPPPAGAKGLFSPAGESLGYVQPDGQFVAHPGYTRDLTRPFPPKLVRIATARIPQKHRDDAMPLFDVNGASVGYLAGPAFYAQGGIADAAVQKKEDDDDRGDGTLFLLGGGGLAVLGGGVGYAITQSGSSGGGGGGGCGSPGSFTPPGSPATPIAPCR